MNLSDVIAKALSESMPRGDLTTRHLKFLNSDGGAKVTAREDLIFAGASALETTVRAFAPDAEFGWSIDEGREVLKGQSVGWIKAPPAALLTAEPLALQLLGRASGIATLARAYSDEMRGTGARITSTRRTTPGMRDLEYDALEKGGAVVPVGDLSEVLRVTAAHARAAGSLNLALAQLRESFAGPIELECDSIDDVELAIREKASRVILTSRVDVSAARAIVPARTPLEAGGVITRDRAREIALAGVDFVRVDQLLSAAPGAIFTISLPPAP